MACTIRSMIWVFFAEVLEKQAAAYRVIRLFHGEMPTQDWERIGALIILGGPITGAALNPARQIGPELLGGAIGAKTHLDQLWVYIAGPIVGGLGGAFLYQFIGHVRTATVPGAAVREAAHAEA